MQRNPRWVVTFDTETTGVDVDNDRIIQAFVGALDENGVWLERREWLIDPGVEIPTGASDVHGYTTERIKAEGDKDWKRCIREIECELLRLSSPNVPIVAYNGSFDMSILNAEMKRAGYAWGFFNSEVSPNVFMIDPYVCDKNIDKYRKGSRKLVNTAAHYGIDVDESRAHDAAYDCYLAGMVAWKFVKKWRGSLASLHRNQIEWAHEQREGLEEYFARSGKLNDDGSPIRIDKGWPINNKEDN